MSARQTFEYRTKVATTAGRPQILIAETVLLDCGCGCHIGRRLDNREAATASWQCGPEHHQLIEHFQLLLLESLADPGHEPLVDVVVRLLDEAERHWQGAPA